MTSSTRFPVLAVAAFALAVAGCVPLKQYRTVTVRAPGSGEVADQVCLERAPNASSDVCSLEKRTYVYGGESFDYYFATVELDDQGWFWDRRQMELVLRFLYERREADGSPSEYVVYAHAHGWQHHADACDNNVVCFQRLLERMDLSERAFHPERPRTVVGLYIAWRGKSGSVRYLNSTTFYKRKDAGARVGIGGVTELLTRLNDFRAARNYHHTGDKTQLIISGHSFGGQLIYKALAQPLIERATRMVSRSRDGRVDGEYGYGLASSFGDLVLLVNPAFEGSAYESLQAAATSRCYPKAQRPVMLVVTSETDQATGVAFPLGRALGELGSRYPCPQERQANLYAVGHLDRYRTHTLRLEDVKPGSLAPKKRKDGPCGCPYLPPIEEFRMQEEDVAYSRALEEMAEKRRGDDLHVYEVGNVESYESADDFHLTSYGHDHVGKEMVLERAPAYAANYPYLVISTTPDFIPDHNTIYGERFTDFLRRFFYRHLVERVNFPAQCFENPNPECRDTDITPCGRSWRQRIRYGCAGGDTP